MRKSIFTYTTRNTDGHLIIYNSLSGKIFVEKDPNLIDEIVCIFSQDQINCVNSLTYGKLIEYELIVDDNKDEIAIADYMFLQNVTNAHLLLTIMPTEECNFRCKYCYEQFRRGAMTTQSIVSFRKWLYREAGKFSGIDLSWFGGEPLEAIAEMEKLTDIIKTVSKARKIPFSAGIVTNGYDLTQEVLIRLIQMRCTNIQVTLDGTRDNHNTYKPHRNGSNTYDVVMNNLRNIRDNCKKQTLSIVVRTNVTQSLLPKIDEIIKTYYDEFGSDRRFSFFFRPVGDWGGDTVKSMQDNVFKKTQNSLLYERIAQNKTPLNYKLYNLELTQGVDICYAAAANGYIIGSDLTVYKCSCKFDDKNNIIGKINADGQLSVSQELVAKWMAPGLNPKASCKNCVLFPQCHNAACIADAVSGRFIGSACPHMKQSLDAYLQILSHDPINYINF